MAVTKDITFSIVAYKNYDQIINAVNSINKFTKKYSKEIIIVDNTEQACIKDYSDQINNLENLNDVQLIQNKNNFGFGKANNIALQHAVGQFFVICNPDILLIEDSFSKIIPYMEKNSQIGAVIPKLIDQHHKIEPVYRRELTPIDVIVR